MFQQEITITYRDSHTEAVLADQSDVAAWELWARQRRLSASSPGATLMQELPVTAMRVMAWSAMNRGSSVRQDYDVWDATVAQVDMADDTEPVDPTPAATLGEPSPS